MRLPAYITDWQQSLFPGLCVLLVIAGAAFHPLTLSFLPHLIGIIGCLCLWRHKTKPDRISPTLILSLTAIAGLTMISSLWAVDSDASFQRGLKITGLLFLFIPTFIFLRNIPPRASRFIAAYFSLPLIGTGAFLFVELAFDFPFLHLVLGADKHLETWISNKHVTILTLLTPFGLYFACQNGQKKICSALLMITVAVNIVTASQAAQLAAAAMTIAAIGAYFLPRLALPLAIISVAIITATMPWISHPAYNIVADKVGDQGVLREACTSQRLEIWSFVADKISERPFYGFGTDAARFLTFQGPMKYYKDTIIMHPHNVALQLWLEFGFLGILLVVGILAALYRHIYRLPYHDRILPLVIFSGVTVFLMASWSIWSSWLMGFILLLIGMYIFAQKAPNDKDMKPCHEF